MKPNFAQRFRTRVVEIEGTEITFRSLSAGAFAALADANDAGPRYTARVVSLSAVDASGNPLWSFDELLAMPADIVLAMFREAQAVCFPAETPEGNA
jgi:hypothetical protein